MTPPTDIDTVLRTDLTDEQYAAATDPAARVLTLACAGSGKSRTLAYRVAWLVARGVDPASIVAFTFTQKAAEAIKLRIGQALSRAGIAPAPIGAMFIGTIHGYCWSVLGRMEPRTRQSEVLDDNRLKLYLLSRYRELGLQQLRHARGAGYHEVIRQTAQAWKLYNDQLLHPEAVAEHDMPLADVLRALDAGLTRECFVDFSLMVRRVAEALRAETPAVQDALAGLTYLHVDEYQDVCRSQETLVQELASRAHSVMALGDDDQALYAWRGADVSNILDFTRRHPGTSRHTLSVNFRSSPPIVQTAARFVDEHLGATRIVKDPRTVFTPGASGELRRVWFATRREEAEWVAEQISRLLGSRYVEQDGGERGLTAADVAILMRSTRRHEAGGTPRHEAFTTALAARGIPYALEAGGKVLQRPQVAVLRRTFELLATGRPSPVAVHALFVDQVVDAFPRAKEPALAGLLRRWSRRVHPDAGGRGQRIEIQALLHELLAVLGLPETPFDAATLRDLGAFSRMIADVEAVYVRVDSAFGFRQVTRFLQEIASDGYSRSTDTLLPRPDAVALSTIHKAKGLEFPAVFVVDVLSQRIPKQVEPYRNWIPQDLVQAAIQRGAYQSRPDEEARLFYTAITRAERYLFVSGCTYPPDAVHPSRPSPYLTSLEDPALLEGPHAHPRTLPSSTPRRREASAAALPLSGPQLRVYLRCPHEYALRFQAGFSAPVTDLEGFSAAVHAALLGLHASFPDGAPDIPQVRQVVEQSFHLPHVYPSRDPVGRPGPYERACERAVGLLAHYATTHAATFAQTRPVSSRYTVALDRAVMSDTVALLTRDGHAGASTRAQVVDVSRRHAPAGESPAHDGVALALRVQLFAHAARDVLGRQASTAHVLLLGEDQGVDVPIHEAAITAALTVSQWAAGRILAQDFPMRPTPTRCPRCVVQNVCPRRVETYATSQRPPALHLPTPSAPPVTGASVASLAARTKGRS